MTPNRSEHQGDVPDWENEGGAAPAAGVGPSELQREETATRGRSQAAVDTSYQSSVRGEHRYPDESQTLAERQARDERDALKRRLRGTGDGRTAGERLVAEHDAQQ